MLLGLLGMLFVAGIAMVFLMVISCLVLLPLQLAIKVTGPNRYGPLSTTRDIGGAISGGFRRAFDFSGRANLVDFWVFALAVGALCFAAFVTVVICTFAWRGEGESWGLTPLAIIPVLAVPSLSMAVRRLHDVNRSGWWLLVLLLAGALALLYWFVQPSQSDAQADGEIFA